jgi:trypsin
MSIESAAVTLDLLATPPGALLPQGANAEQVAAVDDARSWMFGPNVIGWGAAPKVVRGSQTEDAALKLYVERKVPISYLSGSQRIPDRVSIPGVAEVATDVEAIGIQRPESLVGLVRPCPPGYSIGLVGGGSGTFGCIVQDAAGSKYVLSNSHVIGNYGTADAGMPILQPSPEDGGTTNDSLATYTSSVPFNFDPGFNNQCDAAIGSLIDDTSVVTAIPVIGVPALAAVQDSPLIVGQAIQKTGRTTYYTTGVIKDLNYRTLMSYPKPGGGRGTVGFRDQVLCSKYSASGDSGSLVCATDGTAVGLHWAGSDVTSVFSPIRLVLALLGVSLS